MNLRIMKIPAYNYFWAATILITFIGIFLFLSGNDSITFLNIGDTYFVIAYTTLALFFAPLFFIQGLCYWLLLRYNKRPNTSFTQSHTLLSVGSFIGFLLLLWMVNVMHNPYDFFESTDTDKMQSVGIVTILFALFLAQFIFLINMAIALKRK